jgi:hypothetical protein
MVKCGVLFEVRSEFLYIIWTSFGFKGLTCMTTELQYMQFREEIFCLYHGDCAKNTFIRASELHIAEDYKHVYNFCINRLCCIQQ